MHCCCSWILIITEGKDLSNSSRLHTRCTSSDRQTGNEGQRAVLVLTSVQIIGYLLSSCLETCWPVPGIPAAPSDGFQPTCLKYLGAGRSRQERTAHFYRSPEIPLKEWSVSQCNCKNDAVCELLNHLTDQQDVIVRCRQHRSHSGKKGAETQRLR